MIIVISLPTVWTFEKKECILLLPFVMPGQSDRVRIEGFYSTNPIKALVAFFTQLTKTEHPLITLAIPVKKFKGMIDTVADVFIISLKHWPRNWV